MAKTNTMSHEQAVIEARRKVAELLKDCPEVMKVSQLAKALNLTTQGIRDKLKRNPDMGVRVDSTIRVLKSKFIEAAEPVFEARSGQGKEKGS